ncbi:Zinc finger MYM-type protein 1, partial [Pseudolycoriella hygida]
MSKQIDQSEEKDSKEVHKKVQPNLQGQKNVLKQKTLTSFMRKKNSNVTLSNEGGETSSATSVLNVSRTDFNLHCATDVAISSILDDITAPHTELDFDSGAQLKKLQSFRFPYTGSVGFTNWKTAIEVGKGFSRHELSEMHLTAASRKAEKTKRIETDTSISTLVTSTVLLKRRYYFKAIVKTILFLVEHHLALRGNWDKEYHEEDGLFNSLFDFAKERDPDLPLAELLRESIVREVLNADVNFFTILFDGTKDRNGDEIVSLAARFVSSGKPFEVLLFFETTEGEDAETFTTLTLDSLCPYGLDAMRILSQCYDGASVMNGYKSGVAKRLQDVLKKIIPYVHCFNHRLHLVIIHVVKQIQAVKEFFDQLQLIYTMLKKPKIKKIHEGKSMKRLIDTRWTGHKDAAKAILQNYYEFVDTFKLAVKNISKEIDGEDIAICTGILAVITRKTFVFILVCINEILSFLAPADVIFQKREIGYKRAMPVDLLEKTAPESSASSRPVRQNGKRSTLLDDFTVEETIGERSGEETEMKSIYFEIIDVTIAELEARFSENNTNLLALSNADNMDISELKPLETVGTCLLNVN